MSYFSKTIYSLKRLCWTNKMNLTLCLPLLFRIKLNACRNLFCRTQELQGMYVVFNSCLLVRLLEAFIVFYRAQLISAQCLGIGWRMTWRWGLGDLRIKGLAYWKIVGLDWKKRKYRKYRKYRKCKSTERTSSTESSKSTETTKIQKLKKVQKFVYRFHPLLNVFIRFEPVSSLSTIF